LSTLQPRVLIAGGDSATANGIRIALDNAAIEICGTVHSADEVVEAVARLQPDLCLIDVDLPGGGLVAVAEIRTLGQRPDVVMLVETVDEEEFLKAIRLGAVGYVLKSLSPKRLPDVIRAVLLGEPAIPRTLVAVLMSRLQNGDSLRHVVVPRGRGVDLTSREWEVLDLMREGLSTREIADRLLISEVTVRRHIGGVLKKLQVQSRDAALKLLDSA
jgi:two-component system, NarL family, nitrate/nitrite response regulator NarL